MLTCFAFLELKREKVEADSDLFTTSCGTCNGTCCWCSSTVGPYHFLTLQSHQASCTYHTDINLSNSTLFCWADFCNWNSTTTCFVLIKIKKRKWAIKSSRRQRGGIVITSYKRTQLTHIRGLIPWSEQMGNSQWSPHRPTGEVK